MRTKTFSAKRLLSLVLTVAMFVTMILPTSVFAIPADPVAVASAVDNGDGTITRKITISFFEEIDISTALLGSTVYVDDKAEAFGISGSAMDIDPTTDMDIVITIGEAYTAVVGDKIVFNTDCIKYLSDDSYFNGEVEITGSFEVPLADFTDLNDAIDEAGYFDKTDYTPATVAVFEAALATATSIDQATETNQTKVDDATSALVNAMHSLLPLADFTDLNDAIEEANDIVVENYTLTSATAFTTAYNAAKAIDQTTTSVDEQSVVDGVVATLTDAMNNLVPLANFAALNDAIEQAGDVDRNNYTAGSLADLDAAVAVANSINKAEESNQTTVDDAKDAILVAIANLVETRVVEFTAVAVASDVTENYAKADKIYLVFSEAIKNSPNLIADLKVGGEDASSYLSHVGWVDNTIYEMDIIADIDNAAIEFAGNDAVLAVAGHALKGFATTIVGNLDEAYEEVTATEMTATIVNIDDKPYMVNGDKIVLVFNAPVYGNPATITVSGMEFAVVANTDNTVYERVLVAATDSVLAGQELAYGEIKATLKGTFGGTVVPEVVRALVEDVDGTAKTAGDKINIFFNAPTNKVAGTEETNFTGVLAGATGKWLDNQTLVITLADTTITVNDKIDLSNLGIKDFYGTKDADADEIELKGSFGTAIQPALLTLTAISKQGKGAPSAGDEIYLAFNVKMREDALNLQSDFDFNYGDYGTGASVAWATGDEYAEYSTIIITLGEGANVVPGTTKITIEKELFEESGIKSCEVSNLENRIVTGTFGTSIAPSLISASIVKRSAEVGSQPGDQIVLLFNVPTNAADIINLISVAGGDLGNNVEEGIWSNNNTIYTITLGDGTAIANDTSITFTNTNGVLKDINNQKVASTKTLELNGSFGVEADEVGISPSSVTATIVKTTADAGAQAGDKIVFAFNVATNGVDLVNYFKSKGIYGNAGLTGGWSNGNTVYTLVLGDGATVTDTNVAEFTVEAGIKDANEINGAVTLTAGTFIGSFGATITPSSVAPALLSATIVKGDGNTEGEAQVGDKVVFVFNMATNKADLLATLGGSALFGAGAAGEWNTEGNIYTVTLGAGATITADRKLSISGSAGLKDKMEYSGVVEIAEIELVGSFGESIAPVAPIPTLKRAYIVKVSEKYGAQAGDQIVLVFNSSTNAVELINSINVNNVFGTGATGAWSNSNTVYTITLGTGATIEEEDTINIPSTAGLKDIKEISATQDDSIILEGSFGKGTDLHVLSAVAYSSIVNGDYVDFIDIEFNTSVEENIAKEIFTDKEPILLGTNYSVARHERMDNVITITLGNDYSIDKNNPERNKIEFSTQAEHVLVSADGMPLVNDGAEGNPTVTVTGELRKPMVKEIVAVNEGEFGKIQIVFSSKTNAQPVNLSSQSSSLGTNATGTWINNYTLEITLGANRTISVGGGYIVLNGLRITNGFDDNEVVGQYFISKGELPEDELKAVDARVNKRGDISYLTVIFNKPTNMDGNMANVTLNDDSEESSAALFGTNATMTWETATKLVITLGADSKLKNEKELSAGATIAFANLKFANGLGSVDTEAKPIKGSAQ